MVSHLVPKMVEENKQTVETSAIRTSETEKMNMTEYDTIQKWHHITTNDNKSNVYAQNY